MIKVWFDVKQYLKFWGIKFIPEKSDTGFKIWAEKGIKKVGDLYVDNKLMSFEDIVNN